MNCKKLSEVTLESDDIGDAGAEALAAAVVDCKNLTKVELFKSYRIGDAGVAALAAASFAVPFVEFCVGRHLIGLARTRTSQRQWGRLTWKYSMS